MKHTKLPCGLDIYVQHHPSPVSLFQLYTRFGSDTLEYAGENGKVVNLEPGSAHYFEHILFVMPPEGKEYRKLHPKTAKGCRDGLTILENNKVIDVNAFTWNDITNYLFASRLNKEKNLETMLEYVFNTYIPQDRFEQEKGTILDEARRGDNDAKSKQFDVMFSQAYQNHNAKYPVVGTLESIQNMALETLDTTHSIFYRPSNMGLIVTGRDDIEHIAELVQTKLEKMGKGTYLPPPQEVKVDEPKKVPIQNNFNSPLYRADIERPDLMMGWKIMHNQSIDDYIKISFISSMLSGLGTAARDEMTTAGIDERSFGGDCLEFRTHAQIFLTLDTEDYSKSMGVIDTIVENARTKGFAQEEVEYARNNFLLNMRNSLDSVSSIGDSLNRWAVLTGDARNYFTMCERVKTITTDEINASVSDILNPDHRTAVLMVPKKD